MVAVDVRSLLVAAPSPLTLPARVLSPQVARVDNLLVDFNVDWKDRVKFKARQGTDIKWIICSYLNLGSSLILMVFFHWGYGLLIIN